MDTQIENLMYSTEYADYITENNDVRVICNGDTLLEAMESGYLFDEFLESINTK